MSDLTLPEARTERDSLAARTDVLDKVGVLRTLPDDMHVTSEMVAEFYCVGIEAVRSLVKDNRDEIAEDGYRVIVRSEFEKSFGDLSNLDPRARQIAIFPRRAVLRVGMLLRDSDVAKQVRTHLLDAEQINPRHQAEMLTRADLARMILESEEEKAVIAAALESAAPVIAYHDRHIAENDDMVTVKTWGAQFGLTQPQAYSLLVGKNIVYKISLGERWSRSKGRKVEEFEYRARAGRITFDWFEPRPQHNAPRHHNGQVRQTLYVKQFFADLLADKCGLARAARIPEGGAA